MHDAKQPVAAAEQARAVSVSGRPFQKGTSGNSQGARLLKNRTEALVELFRPEFGPEISQLELALLRGSCRLLARAEYARNADAAVRLSSEARRGLESLRKRVRRAPSKDAAGTLEAIRAAYSLHPSVAETHTDESGAEAGNQTARDETASGLPNGSQSASDEVVG
jgi:hypothetical protein